MKQEIKNKLRKIGYTGKKDLKTITNTLPEYLHLGGGRNLKSFFIMTKRGIGYAQNPMIEYQEFCNIQENESLADTAARLLILLVEKGLLTLKEQK